MVTDAMPQTETKVITIEAVALFDLVEGDEVSCYVGNDGVPYALHVSLGKKLVKPVGVACHAATTGSPVTVLVAEYEVRVK